MRRRLVLSTLVVAAVAVVLLGVPLAVAGGILRVDVAEAEVQARAEATGSLIDQAVSVGRAVDTALLLQDLPPDEQAVVTLHDGEVVPIEIEIVPNTGLIRKGQRIRVDVQPASGVGHGNRHFYDPSYHEGARNTIYTGPDHPSWVQLGLLPAERA